VLGIFNTIVPIGTIVNGTEGTLAAISAGDYRAAGKTGIQTLLIAVATAITLGEGAAALAGGKGAGTAAIGNAENAALKNAAKEGAAGLKGGTYGEVRAANNGGQVHHIPSHQVNGLPRAKGPAILMDTADHMQTGAWGSSKQAKAFRAHEQALIEQGRFRDAQQLGVNDIRGKFGTRYDEHLMQLPEYKGPVKE
jgi:hypothetical protein